FVFCVVFSFLYFFFFFFFLFFFSSRRRHTRSDRDWSSDVCSSDLYAVLDPDIVYKVNDPGMSAVWCVLPAVRAAIATGIIDSSRSEERRVGKECRSGWWRDE